MKRIRARGSLRAVLLLGGVYLLIGRVFAAPADHVRVWRLAAWALSGATRTALKEDPQLLAELHENLARVGVVT